MRSIFLSVLLVMGLVLRSQITPFQFIHISDTHIGSTDGTAEEDLRRTVEDINKMSGIAFVVITGDITELGTNQQLKIAKQILDSLHVKYYIIPGNHDSGWSESGGLGFIKTFGEDKFVFDYNGIRFIGCASGPYVRMGDGHVPREAINWLDRVLKNTSHELPLIFLNHYPVDQSLDNWYEIIDRLKQYNTLAILCGHGHANTHMDFEGIPAIMSRSNLRGKKEAGGFNIVQIKQDSIIYSQRVTGMQTLSPWAAIKIEKRMPDAEKKYVRPVFSINDKYPFVKSKWIFVSNANIVSTPVVSRRFVIVGNQEGELFAVLRKTGKLIWSYSTKGSFFSSPAVSKDYLVIGSADGNIYCFSAKKGLIIWKKETGAPVLGSPVIIGDTVFVGGSDHSFYALNLRSGKLIWEFIGLEGPVVTTPLIYNGSIIFGAWDQNLYSLSTSTGKLNWKWTNGSPIINYSPAACIPVANEGIIYIVAPDRYISAIDASDGKTLWRNNEATVRESIGISNDGKLVYAKTMQDSVVAYTTSRDPQHPLWKMNCGFGYEHAPSMLIEKEGEVFFGTKNGVVYSINPTQQRINWVHKIDNSMVNTVRVLDKDHIIVSTVDGILTLLKVNH